MSIAQSGTGITPRTNIKYTNSQGQTVRVVDGEGGSTSFVYDAYGNLVKAIGPTNIAEQMTYDRRGRKVTLINPDSGAWSYEYNGAGELVRQIDAKARSLGNFYDALGRQVERREHPGSESAMPFVTVTSTTCTRTARRCAFGKGKACEVRTATVTRSSVGGALPSPETRQFTVFDNAGRAAQGTTAIDGRAFVITTTFDANGRVDKLQYPSGYMVVAATRRGAERSIASRNGPGPHRPGALARDRALSGWPAVRRRRSAPRNLARKYDGFGRVKGDRGGSRGNPIVAAKRDLHLRCAWAT